MSMRTRLWLFWLCCLLVAGCSQNPPPQPPQPQLRTFGITVRDTKGTLLAPSGVIAADSGETIIGVNLPLPDGGTRLQFATTITGGGWLRLELDGYDVVLLRVLIGEDIEDTSMPPLIQPMSRLRVEGRQIFTADGQPFVWRFTTGFRLVDHVADGNEAAAVAFLDWAKATGFNGVRVLSSLCCWFDLTHEEGQRALPRTLELAQQRGLYLEVVGLAGTKARGYDQAAMAAHIRAIGVICEASPACASIEIANENAHPSQQGDLTDLAFLKSLRSLIPNTVPVSLGSNCCGQSDEKVIYDGGDYVTVHADRSRPTWDRTRHMREQEVISNQSGRFVVDDEPMGAAEEDIAGKRSANPHEFFGRGVLSRVFNVGATFHCEACLHAAVPGAGQSESAASFVVGTRIVPDDVRLRFENASWTTSPVKSAHFGSFGENNATVRAYSGVGGMNILALVGVTGDPGVVFQNGWRAYGVLADRPGFRVLGITR